MIRLLDGPCKGAYTVQRAPLFLRAVRDPSGATDVLDQLEDAPRANETIAVYRREGPAQRVHLNLGRRGSGFYAMAEYRHLAEEDGEAFRKTAAWRAWCTGRAGVPLDMQTERML